MSETLGMVKRISRTRTMIAIVALDETRGMRIKTVVDVRGIEKEVGQLVTSEIDANVVVEMREGVLGEAKRRGQGEELPLPAINLRLGRMAGVVNRGVAMLDEEVTIEETSATGVVGKKAEKRETEAVGSEVASLTKMAGRERTSEFGSLCRLP